MTARRRLRVVASFLLTTAFASTVAPKEVRASAFGALRQLPSPGDCLAIVPAATGCGTLASGLASAHGIAMSPDGGFIYTAARGGAVTVERRNADGSATQIQCISDTSQYGQSTFETCTKGNGLRNAGNIVVSPDGANVYVSSFYSSAVAEFRRNGDGTLTQLAAPNNCITQTPTTGSDSDLSCAGQAGVGLTHAEGIAITPDGTSVYVSAFGSTTSSAGSALAEFKRNADGSLTQLQLAGAGACLTDLGRSDPSCSATVQALVAPTGVVVSPDGKEVYVDSYGDSAVLTLARGQNGILTPYPAPDGCLTQDAVTGCRGPSAGLRKPDLLALSPDGQNLYIAAYSYEGATSQVGSVAALSRHADGSLGQLRAPDNCVTEAGSTGDPLCGRTSAGLVNAHGVGVSPDGRSVYVAGQGAGAIAALARDPASGALHPLVGADTCIRDAGGDPSCPTVGRGLQGASGVAVDPRGRYVYVASFGTSGDMYAQSALAAFARELPPTCSDSSARGGSASTIAVALPCTSPTGNPLTETIVSGPLHGSVGAVDPATGTVSYRADPGFSGTDQFTFSASDGSLGSSPSTATVVVDPAVAQPGTSPAGTAPPGIAPSGMAPSGMAPLPSPSGRRCRQRCPALRRCIVPALRRRSLSQARLLLSRAGCRLGRVRISRRSRPPHYDAGRVPVVAQTIPAGRSLRTGSPVGVRLGSTLIGGSAPRSVARRGV